MRKQIGGEMNEELRDNYNTLVEDINKIQKDIIALGDKINTVNLYNQPNDEPITENVNEIVNEEPVIPETQPKPVFEPIDDNTKIQFTKDKEYELTISEIKYKLEDETIKCLKENTPSYVKYNNLLTAINSALTKTEVKDLLENSDIVMRDYKFMFDKSHNNNSRKGNKCMKHNMGGKTKKTKKVWNKTKKNTKKH